MLFQWTSSRKSFLLGVGEASCVVAEPCICIDSAPHACIDVRWIVPSQLNEYSLHGVLPSPINQTRQLGRVHLPSSLVNTRQVDPRNKLDCGRGVWVAVAAVDVDTVNAVFVDTLEEVLR